MKIRKFNESYFDLRDEFDNVFSYLLDTDSIYAIRGVSPSLKLVIEFDNFPNIFDYIEVFKDVEEGLKKLAISAPLYHKYEISSDYIVIIISRVEFYNCKVLDMQKKV